MGCAILCWILPIILCICTQVHIVHLQCTLPCISGVTESWTSKLHVTLAQPRYLLLEWNADTVATPGMYVVEYQLRNAQTFILATTGGGITDTTFNLTGLSVNTDYNLRVCRVTRKEGSADNCGVCILCASTIAAEEPPSEPQDFRVTDRTPEVLYLAWRASSENAASIRNYTVTCSEIGGSGLSVSRLVISPPSTSLNGLSASTTYTCIVVAFNQYGASPPATISATTMSRTTIPGSLFLYIKPDIIYVSITSSSMKSTVFESAQTLFSTNDTLYGIDYHFDRRELYFTAKDVNGMSAIKTVQMEMTTAVDGTLSFTTSQDPLQTVLELGTDINVSHIMVDWVNLELFYVEAYAAGGSKIMRLMLAEDGSVVSQNCVVEFVNTVITSILVDPVHGYFYWSTASTLFRVDLGMVRVMAGAACQGDFANKDTVASLITLQAFTIEQDEAIYLMGEKNCSFFNPLSIPFSGEGEVFFHGKLTVSIKLVDSFTKFIIAAIGSTLAFIPASTTTACSSIGTSNTLVPAVSEIHLIRMYRRNKQPIPAPKNAPMSIRVTSHRFSAVISWNAPIFLGSLYSADAFDDWIYIVEFCTVLSQVCSQSETTQLSLTLTSLLADTSYVVSVGAELMGDSSTRANSSEFVFTTLPENNEPVWLLIADNSGILRSTLSGEQAETVTPSTTTTRRTPNSVTFDSHTSNIYLASEGSQAAIISSNDSVSSAVLYSARDEPFSLRHDWVGNRVFWIEDGENPLAPHRSFVANLNDRAMAPTEFIKTPEAQATAIDAYNGVFFWTNQATIYMRTLSGLDLAVCHAPLKQASSLAVDVENRHLFWLSGTSAGQSLTISQMEYNSTSCNSASITAHELAGISFSSSSTILAYGSNQLFMSNRRSGSIYTVSSDLASVKEGQSLALGDITLTGNISKILEITDIVISSLILQPLPGFITAETRRLSNLQPAPPSNPPFLGVRSTTTEIVIEWPPSPPLPSVPDAVFFYKVDYTLEREGIQSTDSMVTQDVSVTISGQAANTNVTATITTYSSWTMSASSITGYFLSLPDAPNQVQNVRVFLYRPTTSASIRTALVMWDDMKYVKQYTVNVYLNNGPKLQNLYRPELYLRNAYTVYALSAVREVSFPLVVGQTYQVEVLAMNDAGSGPPSARVSFTMSENDDSFPRQVLSVEASGFAYIGTNVGFNQNLSATAAGPIVVDTVDRVAYWFDQTVNLIYTQPLNSGGVVTPFLMMPSDTVVVSLAYDWIGKLVYVSRVNKNSSRLELIRVSVFEADGQENVFPSLQDTVPVNSMVKSVMSPFTGFFYWMVTTPEPEAVSTLYRINLRTTNATASTPILIGMMRRKRRRRQTTSNLTPALAMNPLTGELILCDKTSGNILRCQPDTSVCSVLVSRAMLETSSSSSQVGLPASDVEYGGQFLYWTNGDGIFAVDLSDPETLITVSDVAQSSSVIALSPEQQILPVNTTCLAPDPSPMTNRVLFDTEKTIITSTTLFVAWTINPEVALRPGCDEIIFSTSPYIYDVTNRQTTLAITKQITRSQEFELVNLLPFTTYTVRVEARNQYTIGLLVINYFKQLILKTLEGVPDSPRQVTPTVLGTSSVSLQWLEPADIRGDKDNLVYIVTVGSTSIKGTALNVTLNNNPPGSWLTIQVLANNGRHNSSIVTVDVQLWPLPPTPVVKEDKITSTSIEVVIVLSDATFGPITEIANLNCVFSKAVIDPSGTCSCSGMLPAEDDFVTVEGDFPLTYTFSLSQLKVFTKYCIQIVGKYISEVTAGVGFLVTTKSGVPNAPTIKRDGSILSWTKPVANGEPITNYTVIYKISNIKETETVNSLATSYNLDTNLGSMLGKGLFTITLTASNNIGVSPESNMVNYEAKTDLLSLTQIIVIAVLIPGGIFVCIIIAIFCYYVCVRSKQESRLSYMYGPDHELSTLRDAIRNAQSSNPHYTIWSMDDFVCTDEDLNLLTKFPRNNLKLETFIDRGEFGEVFQGTATDILGPATGPTPVAVKTLRKAATVDEQKKFLAEAALMANFNHPNIVKVLGVCVDNDPVYIIMELMPGGDLLKFLREAKMDHGPTLLTLPEQIQVALDVAHGCHYLEKQHFIHRDIAGRNCLVSSRGADRVVKIGDFGLAKDLYSSDYYQVEGQRKLPVRWMAPEALLQGKFTVESDVWSYGVLLWEIMTLGNQPYPGRINQEVLQFVTGGGRLDRPDKCPSKINQLMQLCWKRYASDRPHFEHIVNTMSNYMDKLKRPDSVYNNSDTDSDDDAAGNHVQRQGSGKTPGRSPSVRSGILHLARSSSMKLRNSFRRHNSVHKREDQGANSQHDDQFRERGPF